MGQKKCFLLYSGDVEVSEMQKKISGYYEGQIVPIKINPENQDYDLKLIKKKALKYGADKVIVFNTGWNERACKKKISIRCAKPLHQNLRLCKVPAFA